MNRIVEKNGNPEKTPECRKLEGVMADLLFDPAAAPAAAREHLVSCSVCMEEIASLQGTMQVLDSWELEEPSPFWTARMEARLREEQRQPARGFAGWFSGFRTRLWVSNHTMKPAGVAALGLLLAVCGGTWMELAMQQSPVPTPASNTVRDLQSINENSQVFQALASLDTPDTAAGTSTASN